MNALSQLKVSKAEFFRFVSQQAEGRFEYEEGRIVQQMTGGTFAHSLLIQQFITLLQGSFPAREWAITGQSRGVETAKTVRYPDVVLERRGANTKDLSTAAPSLLIEVLSPTTESLDLNVKPPEYMSLAALQAYIVASQDDMLCLVWQRGEDGRFPELPVEWRGSCAIISVDAFGITLPLADIYRGIIDAPSR